MAKFFLLTYLTVIRRKCNLLFRLRGGRRNEMKLSFQDMPSHDGGKKQTNIPHSHFTGIYEQRMNCTNHKHKVNESVRSN